ncbi:MAG TPA: hypothetical protein VD815_10705 [Candidatus Saccharimonadales bacterium]|nr:hypothetical protein [Candidatus Saccharimonadales bacterium]
MNEIEHETSLSKGTINNIIHDWKARINGTDIEEIRGFIAQIRKSGMTLRECSQAFRVANIMRKMGVYDELDDPMVNEADNDNEKEIRPKEQITDNKTVKWKEEIEDKEEQEKELSNGFADIQKTNILDLITSGSSTSQDSKMTHQAKPKIFENNKISSIKRYQITDFVYTIYKNCKHHGITPTILFNWIIDVFNLYSVLSDPSWNQSNDYHKYQNNHATDTIEKTSPIGELLNIQLDNEIPLVSRISFLIEQKKNETHKLLIKRNTIVEEINRLNEQREKVQTLISNLCEKEKNIISYLQWYSNLREDLRNRFNLIIEAEFEVFSNVINDFNEYGYNTSLLIKEYKEFESLRRHAAMMREEIELKRQDLQDLQTEISNLEVQSYKYRQTMSTYEELRRIGFGLKELKQLNGLILEVSYANNIQLTEALPRFLKDLEKNYDNRLGLESKIKELQIEIEHLSNKVLEKQYHLLLQDTAAPNLVTLYAKGLTNSDIINITNLVLALENSYLLGYKSIRKDYDYNSGKIDIITRNEF